MTIEALMKVVPPPAAPLYAFEGPWEPLEANLGAAFPQDYKDIVRTYGGGVMFNFLKIKTPKSENPITRLGPHLVNIRKVFLQMDDLEPYGFWPEPGGLIAFGTTYNGDELFWLPEGAPADWKVVVWWRGGGFEPFEVFDCGLSDFLVGLATNELRSVKGQIDGSDPFEPIFDAYLPLEKPKWKWVRSGNPDAT
jgi:hypothetical protein